MVMLEVLWQCSQEGSAASATHSNHQNKHSSQRGKEMIQTHLYNALLTDTQLCAQSMGCQNSTGLTLVRSSSPTNLKNHTDRMNIDNNAR